MQETMEFWKAVALRKPIEKGIYCKALQNGTFVFLVNVGYYVYDSVGIRKKRFLRANCKSLEEARIKHAELRKESREKVVENRKNKIKKRIAQLEQELEDYKATLEVMSDKELYEAVISTDENSELYDESEINWNV